VALIPLIARDTPQAKLKGLNGPTYTNFDSVLWNIQTWSK
jgi:peptide/nickel transport system substrate-binding protein